MCWLREHREGYPALGCRALPPRVRDGPIWVVPSASRDEGLCRKRHWMLPSSGASIGIFISLVFVPPSFSVGYRVVLFCFVLFSLRVGKRRREGRSARYRPKISVLSCWHQGVCRDAACCIQTGRRTSRETKRELWRAHSLFVFGSEPV